MNLAHRWLCRSAYRRKTLDTFECRRTAGGGLSPRPLCQRVLPSLNHLLRDLLTQFNSIKRLPF
jgi:hypothetical protein